MKKLICFVMMTAAVFAQAKQSENKVYDKDDYWFDYQIIHSSKAPAEWLSKLGVNPSTKKYIMKFSIRHNQAEPFEWALRHTSVGQGLRTKDPFKHSRIQGMKKVEGNDSKPYILALLWVKEGKEVEIQINAVIDNSFKLSASLPFQANYLETQ